MPVFSGEIKILSYNVWFDDVSGNSYRYAEINRLISDVNPDFVCLQEVTPAYYMKLKKQFSNRYHLYDDNVMSKQYGNVILAKSKARQIQILELDTRMGRKALIVRTNSLTITNLHLESMLTDTTIRVQQLGQIKKTVSKDERVVICGDFNFGDNERENQTIVEFHDHGKQSPDATYDIGNNRFAKLTKFSNEPSRRLDRIITRIKNKEFKYEVRKVVFSDHYPVILTLYDK